MPARRATRGKPDRRADWDGRPVRIFVMGDNLWRDEQEWPLARAMPTPFFLHSTGGANSLAGDGRLDVLAARAATTPDTFTYDPAKPVPTGTFGAYSRTPGDRREVQKRPDVLVYTSAPLTAAPRSDRARAAGAVDRVVGDATPTSPRR